MNREMMRESRKIGKRMMKLPENEFQEISQDEIYSITPNKMKKGPDRVWRNNHYVVQLYRKNTIYFGVLMDKIMIRRNDAEPIREWHCLQRVKNQICGEETMAIQIFPEQSKLVDVANMYWLFIKSGEL